MTTVICDKCRKEIIFGFVCKEDYFPNDNPGSRTQWLMQQSQEDKTKHICYNCMNEIIKEKK